MQTKLEIGKGDKKTAAEYMAGKQREISVSEFFLKNRHLLGFDNPRKALLTTVKEAVDNSLDAAEEAGIIPEVIVKAEPLKDDRYKVTIEDNGPGIVKEHVPKVFGKLLYGSKFHRLKCSRGQQGIGISSAGMYGQLTTGKAVKVWSRISPKKPAWYFEIFIDTKINEPQIVKQEEVEWDKQHGIKVEIEMEGKHQKGRQSVDDYLKQVAIANPHARIVYESPDKERIEFPAVTKEMPKEPKEIKPHPYGVELGILMKMLKDTKSRNLSAFLKSDFCRVSPKIAKEICEKANLYVNARPSRIAVQEVDALYKAIQTTKIMAPPTDCLVPIGEGVLLKGLKKEINADFYAAVTRPPSVYRGNPFQIEVAIAYGGDIQGDGLVKVLRFANRVPLLYQQSACASYHAVVNTAWNNYGLSQSKGALPAGPVLIMMHMSSVWVPFTSEAKEAIASYPQIIKEMKLALQECGRQLGTHIRKQKRQQHEAQKKSYIEKYLPHIGIALREILKLQDKDEKKVLKILKDVLESSRQ